MKSFPRPNSVLVFSLIAVLLLGLNPPAAAEAGTHRGREVSSQVPILLAASAAALYRALTLLGQHRGGTPAQNQDIQGLQMDMQGGHRELTRLQKLTATTAMAVLGVCDSMPPWASQLTIMGMVQVVGHINAADNACRAAARLLPANPFSQ